MVEEHKDPFLEFINTIEAINHLGDTKTSEQQVFDLVSKYGLPIGEEPRLLLVKIIEGVKEIRTRLIPITLKHYLVIYLFDLIQKHQGGNSLNPMWEALMAGMALGEMTFEDEPDEFPEE